MDRPPALRRTLSLRRPFPVVDVHGSGEAAGELHGSTARKAVQRHLEDVLARLAVAPGLSAEEAYERAAAYRAPVTAAAPHLAAEIDGIARGADIPRDAAWLLQVRAEVGGLANPECTTIGVEPTRSETGASLLALNADLPSAYGDVMIVLRRTAPTLPTVLTVTPAGQLGHHGVNDAGLAVVANFLHSPGWTVGVPRYLWTRLVLEERSADAAVERVDALDRAASRNLLIADRDRVVDLETTVARTARVPADDGLHLHTNHYLSELAEHDTADDGWLRNSRHRLGRTAALLGPTATIGPAELATVLRDRDGVPDAICHHAGELEVDVATVCSTIIDVDGGVLWVSPDAPDLADYHPYAVHPA